MAQWWNTPIRFIDVQGNIGTLQGDTAAAARYLEVGMSKFTWDNFFNEWSNNITEFVPNYTNDTFEPEILPSAFPIILCKNISGLGYGASTGIPYFCPNEMIDAMINLIKKPKSTPVLIPDSPTGCPIVESDWEDMCRTGYGSFIYRGEAIIEGNTIKIKSIPNSTSTLSIIGKIKDQTLKGKLLGIEEMVDNTDEDENSANIDLHIIVKKGFSPEQILDKIYKSTELQTSFTVKLDVVYDYANYHLSLKALMLNWIEFRRETKRRFISSEYTVARKRMHLLEAIIKILSDHGVDKLLAIGKKSKNRKNMVDLLIKEFKLTLIQAEALSEMKFYNLSEENMDEYKADLKKNKKIADGLIASLTDDEVVDETIISELKYFKDNYGIARKSKIIPATSVNQVPDSKHYIAITAKGYIKKLDSEYTSIGEIKEGDNIQYLMKVNNRESILLFDESSFIYRLNIHDIPSTGKKVGIKIHTLIGIKEGAKIVSVINRPNDKELESSEKVIYVVTTTADGYIKKSIIGGYSNVGARGLIAGTLAEGDKLVDAKIIKGDKDIVIYTVDGNYVKFNTSEFSDTGRSTRGSSGIKLAKTDSVAGFDILQKTKNYAVILTNKGNGKKCLIRNFDTFKRGSAGDKLIKLKKGEKIVSVESARNGNELFIYTINDKMIIPVADIPELLKLGEGQSIVKIDKKDAIMQAYIR